MKKKLLFAVIALILTAGVFAQSEADFTVDANGVITKYVGFDTDVVIPATIGGKRITAIGEKAFEKADLTSVTIPMGITSIGESAFADNKITSLTLPGTVRTIGDRAFQNNPLAAIVLPEGVETVGENSFGGTKCTSVSLPSTLISISKPSGYNGDSFDTSANPSFILAANINADFYGSGFTFDYENPITMSLMFANYIANGRKAGTYTLNMKCDPKTAEGYGYYETEYGAVLTHFQDRDATRVRVPSEIGGMAVKALYETYSGMSSIVAVQIPEGITYIGTSAFSGCQLASVAIPAGVTYIGNGAFGSSRDSTGKMTSVTIPAGVTYIGDEAFSGNELASVTIPTSVTYIGNLAFARNKLTSVTIPASVTYIGYFAFGGNDIKTITIPATVKTLDGLPITHIVVTTGNTIVMGAGINVIVSYANKDGYSSYEGGKWFAEAYQKNGAGRYTYDFNKGWVYSAR
jgi:hypothetical protein